MSSVHPLTEKYAPPGFQEKDCYGAHVALMMKIVEVRSFVDVRVNFRVSMGLPLSEQAIKAWWSEALDKLKEEQEAWRKKEKAKQEEEKRRQEEEARIAEEKAHAARLAEERSLADRKKREDEAEARREARRAAWASAKVSAGKAVGLIIGSRLAFWCVWLITCLISALLVSNMLN